MVMNAYKKPYDDIRVRQALNHACNVDLWIEAILGKLAYRVAGMWGPAVLGYDPSVKPYEYNPDKAKQLLTEAGYPNGFETSLVFAPDGSVTSEAELAQAVVADLAKVGVTVKLQPTEFNTTVARYVTVYNPDAELWIGSNANNTADADYNLTTNVYSKGRGPDRTGYYIPTPPDIDDAILAGRKIVDEKQRLAHYQQLYKKMVDLAPMVFWFDLADSYGVSKRLKWSPRADEVMSLRNASVAK
jgi:peptide/nickel transport system substrate-binding protein